MSSLTIWSHTYTRKRTRAGLAALSAHTGVSGILVQTPDRDHDEGREIHNDEARKTARDGEQLVPLNKTGKDCDLIWGETDVDGRAGRDVRRQADKRSWHKIAPTGVQ